MDTKDADQLLMMYSSKLSPEYIPTIKSRLLEMEHSTAILAFSDLKDPTTALIISICEGLIAINGISRFYIGDVGIGIAKLLYCVITRNHRFIPQNLSAKDFHGDIQH